MELQSAILPRSITILFIMGMATMAGCVGHPSSNSSPFLISPEWCEASSACLDDGTRVFDGLPDSSGSMSAIRIEGSAPVVLRNIQISSGEVGIQWTGAESCTECRLTVEGASIFSRSGGIDFQIDSGVLTIRNSTINVQPETPAGLANAFGISLAAGTNVRLDNVSIQGNGMAGISGRTQAPFTVNANQVLVAGFEAGILGGVTAIHGNSLKIDCEDVGVLATLLESPFTAQGLQIDGCSEYGVYIASQSDVSLEHVSVSNSLFGIEIPASPHVSVSSAQLLDNGYGLQSWYGLTGEFLMDNSRIERSQELGLSLQAEVVAIASSSFRLNGQSAGNHPVPASEFRGGIYLHNFIPEAVWVISSSAFESNGPYAVVNEGLAPVLDARNNWWGDPAGPSVELAGGPAVSVGPGTQVVRGPALVHPAMSGPP